MKRSLAVIGAAAVNAPLAAADACGKSTLLRVMPRLLTPTSGAVLLAGTATHRLSTRQVARALGLPPHTAVAPEDRP